MSKVNILNLILLTVVIALGYIIYSSEKVNTELDRLTAINANEVSAITIRYNENRVTLIKDSLSQWRITQPISIDANNFRISSLLKLLAAPVHTQYHVNEIDLPSIGLSTETMSISFDNTKISFGNINPATSLRYLRIDDVIYTIQDAYFPLISSGVSTLASLNLVPNNKHIKKLILKNQTISKNDQGLWQSNIEITADNINKTLYHWQNDQAFGVHKYLQREQLGQVFIYLEGVKEAISFTITDTEPWLILARPELSLEFHLDASAYENLIAPKN